MIAVEPTTHIRVDKNGVAWVDDTKVKVVEVILDHLAYGHSAEEIHLQHPHLSLAQIHAAFAYYYDHQAELEHDLERRRQRVSDLRQKVGTTLSRKTLRARLKRA
ncbi:MAG: DUF433 domain-containing protein [Verrucomicrobiae bacterium]|nr:DUF433 domain-containing protein [Verrucomicrobiae bacterium]